MCVFLANLRQKCAGWRAKLGRFWKPSDEQGAKKKMKTEEFVNSSYRPVSVDWAREPKSSWCQTPVEVTVTGEQVYGGTKVLINGLRTAVRIDKPGRLAPGIYPATLFWASRYPRLTIHIGAGPLRSYIAPLPSPLPTGKQEVVGIPSIPYAGCWSGAESFSRSICSGNYRFGAVVDGDVRPLLANVGGRECLVIEALSPTRLETHSTSGGHREWNFAVGEMWTVGEGGIADNFREIAVEAGDTVDSLGRW
ncbi:MAG: hypothetical protein COT91_01960 [Candidatus Doudnabacteria bacterium CG10_big_fil_rev_8_21_14_0_10_41_10]|uniref:Uncharacterized protein n=1 Tax=Candidatus Doudnabacteria bacterium CG10_big_fil_rev_8_21_14_0_10_41_10 TaxID=1974551 RepID=A0A2H0VE29_9BACT|nr:MAG: hypothetical protein COT91_01960 [Candidatus Doudnabacteria bacterium CG10_big_fil_rev_8_21_14_0_10_41_10]